jgi:eukaryotic-like serine/threonine-protein kinase
MVDERDVDENRVDEGRISDGLPGGTGWVVDGRYRVERLIGKGGVGVVYEATRLATGERVAIKLVHVQYANDDGVVSRFAREAKAASAVDNPHIVRVLDSGTHEGRPFLVIELLLGEDLGARLRRTQRLSERETVHVILQLLYGLMGAHAAGIVHRDLKPDNVFLVDRANDTAFVKIVDFGTSKIIPLLGHTAPLALTHRGVVVGTPLYMSPEQAEAKTDVDERSDLYSAGAIAFECLTGRPPHVGESDQLVLGSIRSTKAPKVRSIEPTLPEGLGAFVDKALARAKSDRFASARQMFEALAALAPLDPVAKLPLPPPRVILVGAPADQELAFADTLPHSSQPPTKIAEAARPRQASSAGMKKLPESRAPSSATPKERHAAWSWAVAFVAALGGVITTAWVVSSLGGPAATEGVGRPSPATPRPPPARASTASAAPSSPAAAGSAVTGDPPSAASSEAGLRDP